VNQLTTRLSASLSHQPQLRPMGLRSQDLRTELSTQGGFTHANNATASPWKEEGSVGRHKCCPFLKSFDTIPLRKPTSSREQAC